MDVFRIEQEPGGWTLYKAHGYKPILHAQYRLALIEHVLALTAGNAAVIRFTADGNVRELRVGKSDDEETSPPLHQNQVGE